MATTTVEQRLRSFLLTLSASMCVGTIVELFLAKHYDEPMQLVPFVLCGIGLIAVAAAWRVPRRTTLLALRAVMGLLLVGSLLGVYEHLASNFAFELEMRPGAVWTAVWLPALRGAAPLLAPSILALAGVIAIAATYEHPALERADSTQASSDSPAGEPHLVKQRRI